MANQLHVTQIRSAIKAGTRVERTIRALGFKRLNQTVVHEDTPEIRGMVYRVRHLVRVEEIAR